MKEKNKLLKNCSKVFLVLLAITFTTFLIVQHDLMWDVYSTYVNGNPSRENNVTKANVLHTMHYRRTNYGHIYNDKFQTMQSVAWLSDADKSDINSKIKTLATTKVQYYMFSETGSDDIRNKWPVGNRKSLAVFILSAIGYNWTTVRGYKHEIKLNGWHGAKHKRATIKCCVLYVDGKTSQYVSPKETTRGRRLHLVATQLTCPVKDSLLKITGVIVEFARTKCSHQQSDYIVPLFPKLQPELHTFALLLKILYGNIDNKLLIDWIEFYMEIKVDKLFMFVYNITEDTKTVIRFYERLGFLETRHFAFPWKKGALGRNVGMKTPVVWEDEQVVVYDSFYRLHGYTYLAIIDLDEFLLPRKYGNIKNTMESLMKEYPKAAGFNLKSFIFNKDWGVSGRSDGSDVVKYIQRTRALTGSYARTKNILIPSRVSVDRHLGTHNFDPKSGYERYTVPESIIAVNHYRACYSELKQACDKRKRIMDTSLIKIIDKIHNRASTTF